MDRTQVLLDKFISATIRLNEVVELRAGRLQISPHVYTAIQSARKLLPITDDFCVKNRVVSILHDIYNELRKDIKERGNVVNGQKHPGLDPSLQAYRIIIS